MAEERIGEPEDRSSQSKQQKGQRLRGKWGEPQKHEGTNPNVQYIHLNIWLCSIIGIPEAKEKEKGPGKKYLEK